MKHPNGTEKAKKFEGFTNRPANQEIFEFVSSSLIVDMVQWDSIQDGQRMSVADFFLGKYNFRLKCPRFPCLKVSSFAFLQISGNGPKEKEKTSLGGFGLSNFE